MAPMKRLLTEQRPKPSREEATARIAEKMRNWKPRTEPMTAMDEEAQKAMQAPSPLEMRLAREQSE